MALFCPPAIMFMVSVCKHLLHIRPFQVSAFCSIAAVFFRGLVVQPSPLGMALFASTSQKNFVEGAAKFKKSPVWVSCHAAFAPRVSKQYHIYHKLLRSPSKTTGKTNNLLSILKATCVIKRRTVSPNGLETNWPSCKIASCSSKFNLQEAMKIK